MKPPWLAILFGLLAGPSLVHADAKDDFRLGVGAFRAGDFPAAVAAFEAAERGGMKNPRLSFNLGSSYYKLGRYDAARDRFAAVAGDPQWGALAHYNLGLIAELQGQPTTARSHFQRTLDLTDANKLRELARRKLARDSGQSGIDLADRWFGLFSFAGGFDDNVVLADDPAIIGVSDEQDEFVTVVGAASRYLTGDLDGGLRLDLGAFGEAYRDLDDFSAATGSAGLVGVKVAAGWHVETSLNADLQAIGGDFFASTGTLSLRASHPLGERSRIRLRSDTSHVEGASQYDYLTGWRQRLGAELQHGPAASRIRIGYLFELNDRDDFLTAEEFSSYSPTRNTVYVRLERNLAPRVRAEIQGEYRMSRYDDENRSTDAGGTTVFKKRDEDRLSLGLRTDFSVAPRLNLFLDYRYARNDSNLPIFEYDANRLLLGVESWF